MVDYGYANSDKDRGSLYRSYRRRRKTAMGLKGKLNKAVKPVKHTPEDQARDKKQMNRFKPLPESKVLEVTESKELEKAGDDYVPLEVRGSNGKTYKIVVPKAFKSVPKDWKWDGKRYKAAELLAAGYPLSEVADTVGYTRQTLYCWLQHPEFKEHVDGLTLESGWANQRERIAGLNRVTRLLFDKVINELGQVKLTDKSVGAVLSSLQMIAKQISQEKGEFIEQSKVDSNTTINGTLGVAEIPLENILNEKTAEERRELEAEFNRLGDDIIRSITGEK